ncbi:hypothetical protein [Azospirillum sp. ST 5-10]|uniref:hypothetical protein n=1 Tax=unclassified Azospirillum TaxID=2630922 RepID=UPI003F4A5C4C
MRIDLRPAADDILQEAFVCVVGSDVVTRASKRTMLAALAALKAARGCPPAACAGCALRRDCEARVVDIIGAAEAPFDHIGAGAAPFGDDRHGDRELC